MPALMGNEVCANDEVLSAFEFLRLDDELTTIVLLDTDDEPGEFYAWLEANA